MNNLEIVNSSLDVLYRTEPELISERAHEQAISARLMLHLQHLYPDWNVDVEYNREGVDRDPKTDEDGHNRKPDIIVHRRGAAGPNLVIILVKCEWNKQDREADRTTLSSLKRKHNYEDAFLIEIKADVPEVIAL